MTLFDFRVIDLVDRMDWTDPDFPACMRMLEKISIPAKLWNGQRLVDGHIITVNGEPALIPSGIAVKNES